MNRAVRASDLQKDSNIFGVFSLSFENGDNEEGIKKANI